jgi:hypothetical protein
MTSKLLGYSLGRSLVDRDDGTIEQIVDRLEANDFKAQTRSARSSWQRPSATATNSPSRPEA